ncbi:MAG: L,D-transpeptidase family protein [Bacteroidota bacterium]
MLFKNVIHIILLVLIMGGSSFAQVKTLAFKSGQLKSPRVRDAYETKWPQLQQDLKSIGVNPDAFDIYMRAFKYEQKVEVWIKNSGDVKYQLFKTYEICANSGDLGPKRKEGDGQVPEGFYKIDLFNPKSDYYLSMRISYPNTSDVILKDGINAGGAIMMHGNCVTIGCLPMTDEKIKELYVLCLEARNRNNPIYIDIYPVKFTPENIKMLETNYPKSKIHFWKTLKTGYDYFEMNKWLPIINIDSKGNYFLDEEQAKQKLSDQSVNKM